MKIMIFKLINRIMIKPACIGSAFNRINSGYINNKSVGGKMIISLKSIKIPGT